MRQPVRYIIKKEILGTDGKFICYKYYFKTLGGVPEWVDAKSMAMRFSSQKEAAKAIEDMRFLVIARMSVEEIKL